MKSFFKRILYTALGLLGFIIFMSFLIIEGVSRHDVANISTVFCLVWITIQGLFWFNDIKSEPGTDDIPIIIESNFQRDDEELSLTHSEIEYIQYYTHLYGSAMSFTSKEERLILKWKKEGFSEQRIREMLEWNIMN